jgi:Rha family phage regulatory protein
MKQIEQTISSLDVADMVGKEHKELLRDIRRYEEQFSQSKIAPPDFFQKTEYTNRGKKYPCYKITKKGCEFIAHKLTGVKGTEFTAKYINKFHEMEQIIADHIPQGKELLALAVLEAQKTIEDLQASNTALIKDNERMRPKEIFADAVTASDTYILVGELAKILKQKGINIGQNKLFQWMREKGYLIKRKGIDWNMPTQKAMEMKLFWIEERTITNPDGTVKIRKTTKVTGKGQQYFINKFLSQKEINTQLTMQEV